MQAVINEFITGVRNKKLLIDFISKSFINIRIKSESEVAHILINYGNVTLSSSKEDVSPDVEIYGEGQIIKLVLLGKIKLREAVRRKQIKVQATFRMTLYLETLFALAITS